MLDRETCIDSKVVSEAVIKYGLSKLKLLKLLFFASVVKIDDKRLLDDVFDKFYAMPYGPVESDVYNQINNTPNYILDNKSISLKGTVQVVTYKDEDSNEVYQRIKKSVKELLKINSNLFKMSTYDLVELSHKSDSWRIIYSEAQRKGKYSQLIPPDIIESTTVYFR